MCFFFYTSYLYQNNPEVNKMVTQEQITLQNLINEFENKINEKENQLSVNKEKIKQSLLELQNRPLIQKNNINNNGINNNYNYNYYIKQDNNGNYNIPGMINYNIGKRNKMNELDNNKNNIASLYSLDSGNENSDIKNQRNNNANTYTYSSYPQNQYEKRNNEIENDMNFQSNI